MWPGLPPTPTVAQAALDLYEYSCLGFLSVAVTGRRCQAWLAHFGLYCLGLNPSYLFLPNF